MNFKDLIWRPGIEHFSLLILKTLQAPEIGMDLLDITVPETVRSPLVKQIMPTESPKWLPGQPFPYPQLGVNWVLTWVFRRKLANFQGGKKTWKKQKPELKIGWCIKLSLNVCWLLCPTNTLEHSSSGKVSIQNTWSESVRILMVKFSLLDVTSV